MEDLTMFPRCESVLHNEHQPEQVLCTFHTTDPTTAFSLLDHFLPPAAAASLKGCRLHTDTGSSTDPPGGAGALGQPSSCYGDLNKGVGQ